MEEIEELGKILKSSSLHMKLLCEDGSNRKYYRIFLPPQKSLVMMKLEGEDALRLQNGSYDWLHVAKTLEHNHIRTPQVEKVFADLGSIVMEDCGDDTLELKLSKDPGSGSFVFDKTAKILSKFLSIPIEPHSTWGERSFDFAKLSSELEFFSRHFIENRFHLDFTPNEMHCFRSDCQSLCQYLSSLPQYFVHRDFHSRNLMVKHDELIVIDFQDARRGPAAYDAVSLCFDSYIKLNISERVDLLQACIKTISIQNSESAKVILSSWKPVLLQRQLKAIGSFAYLTQIKQKRSYTQYMIPALNILNEVQVKDERWPYLSSEFLEKLLSLTKVHLNHVS